MSRMSEALLDGCGRCGAPLKLEDAPKLVQRGRKGQKQLTVVCGCCKRYYGRKRPKPEV